MTTEIDSALEQIASISGTPKSSVPDYHPLGLRLASALGWGGEMSHLESFQGKT